MSTRVFLPQGAVAAPFVDPEPTTMPEGPGGPPADADAARRRHGGAVSGSSLKTFSVLIGVLVGCGFGAFGRSALHLTGLSQQVAPATLGFLAGAWGLSLCFLLRRLMERAEASTRRVYREGEAVEVPLRRRGEVVTRAFQYLVGLTLGFVGAIAGGAYLLRRTVPGISAVTLSLGPDVYAYGAVMTAALLTLATGEWVVRLTRKQGRTDHGPFVLAPAQAALGMTLAGWIG